MAFTINTKLGKASNEIYFDPIFRAMIEEHINVLRSYKTSVEFVSGNRFYKYEGNFYGLLDELGYNRNLWWIILRVNNMHNPNEFAKENRSVIEKPLSMQVIIPHEETIKNLIQYRLTIQD